MKDEMNLMKYHPNAWLMPVDMPRTEYPTIYDQETHTRNNYPPEALLMPPDMPRTEYPTNEYVEKKLHEALKGVEITNE